MASSVWRPEFKGPLEAYPEFDLIPLDFAVPACDACHLGGRMSTLVGRLSGSPYDKLGFEILVCPKFRGFTHAGRLCHYPSGVGF